MSKAAAIVSLSPLKFVPGSLVLADDLVNIIKASNYAAANCPEVHGALYPGLFPVPQIVADQPGAGYIIRHDWWFRLDEDVRALRFYAECDLVNPTPTMDVKLTIDGVDVVTFTFAQTDNGTYKNASIATTTGGGSIAPGERNAWISIRTAGGVTGGPYQLKWWSLQEDVIDPATFPSPTEDILSIDG